MEKGFNLDMNQKDCSQMVKNKDMGKIPAGEMQWPFSSNVFLPAQYKYYNMSPKAPAMETSPSLWHISSLDHNAKPPSFHHKLSSDAAKSSNGFHKPTSINLFSNNHESSQLPPALTILYSGSVHVYNGVSPATVEAIKSIASREHSPLTVETKQSSLAENIKLHPSNAAAYPPEMTQAKSIAGALTMARKATLARFLQKRKYRLTNAKPYEVACEKKLYCPTPQSPTTSFFNLLPMLLQEGTGSSSNYS